MSSQTSMDSATLAKVAKAAGDLPAMPDVVDKVVRIVSDPDCETKDLRTVIEHDPGLAGRVLRIANSTYYRRMREIKSLDQAIGTLGFRTIMSITMATSTKTMFDQYSDVARQVRSTLWDHSISTAFLASSLMRLASNPVDRELAFLGGLLHDIGRLVISRLFPTQFTKILHRVEIEGAEPEEVEMEILGFNHEQLGSHLAREWQLPEALESVIGHHHDFDKAPEHCAETALVGLADQMAGRLGWDFPGPEAEEPLTDDPALAVLGIEASEIESKIDDLREEVEGLKGLF